MAGYKLTGNPLQGGAFKATESLKGSQGLSTKHMPKTQGKMSSAHGTNSGNSNKGLNNTGNRIGQGRGFHSSHYKQGPCPIGGKGRKKY